MSDSSDEKSSAKSKVVSRKDSVAKRHALNKVAAEQILTSVEFVNADVEHVVSALDSEGIFNEQAKLPSQFDIDLINKLCSRFKPLKFGGAVVKKEIYDLIRDRRAELSGKKGNTRRKKRAEEATKKEYWTLFEDVLGTLKRDVFSGELLYRDAYDGFWKPANNRKEFIRSRAIELNQLGELDYPLFAISPHLAAYKEDKTPGFVIDIPEWDMRDRVGEIATAVELDESAGIKKEHFVEFVREWLAIMWERLENPQVQNRIIVLKGGQGIGKDRWISALVGGAGQFAINMSVIAHDKDTYLQLAKGLVLKIAEFDRAAKTDSSFIKDIISREDIDLRKPYAEDPEPKFCRASFIASCNSDDILRDDTGNRRYLIFTLSRIEWGYPDSKEDQLQVLAQAAVLAAEKYRAREEAQEAMREYLGEHKPVSQADQIVELWEEFSLAHFQTLSEGEQREIKKRGWFTVPEARPILDRIRTQFGRIPADRISSCLKKKGFGIKSGSRGYRIYIPPTRDSDFVF